MSNVINSIHLPLFELKSGPRQTRLVCILRITLICNRPVHQLQHAHIVHQWSRLNPSFGDQKLRAAISKKTLASRPGIPTKSTYRNKKQLCRCNFRLYDVNVAQYSETTLSPCAWTWRTCWNQHHHHHKFQLPSHGAEILDQRHVDRYHLDLKQKNRWTQVSTDPAFG